MSLNNILVPAGSGIHTVHTRQSAKANFQHQFYGDDILFSYNKSFPSSADNNGPIVLGIPFDNGAGILRGCNWGPLFLRSKLLEAKKNWRDLGDIRVIPHLLHDSYLNQKKLNEIREGLYDNSSSIDFPVSPLSMCEYVAEHYFMNYSAPLFILGGDHSISRPFAENYIEKHSNAAIIHFDAHTDLMEKRLGIDMCFATWAYHVSSKIKDSNRFIQLGIRSSGKDKDHWEEHTHVTQIWANEIAEKPVDEILEAIVKKLDASGVKNLYISFDIDSIDQTLASMCGTPESGGITPHIVIQLIRELASRYKVDVIDFVELAPYTSFEIDPIVMRNSLQVAGQLAIKFYEILEEQCL